jgi:hypothetical protein
VQLDADAEQQSVIDAVRDLLARTASARPAPAAVGSVGLDRLGLAALASNGFLDVAADSTSRDHLNAVLVIEQGEQVAAAVPIASRALVAPYLQPGEGWPDAVGLAYGDRSIVRYGAEVDAVLMLDGDSVRLLTAGDYNAEPIQSRMAYPLARISVRSAGRSGVSIGGPDAAARLTRAWRTALATELAGAMVRAVEVARAHVTVRTQFGRPIGSFQAVAHRLADAYVTAQACTWLARRAAWNLDDDLPAAVAATHATAVAQNVFDSVHQVVGAIGFTTEFDLRRSTMRIPVLLAEHGGPASHARAVSRIKWQSAVSYERTSA